MVLGYKPWLGLAKRRAVVQALRARNKPFKDGNWKVGVFTLDQEKFFGTLPATSSGLPAWPLGCGAS